MNMTVDTNMNMTKYCSYMALEQCSTRWWPKCDKGFCTVKAEINAVQIFETKHGSSFVCGD